MGILYFLLGKPFTSLPAAIYSTSLASGKTSAFGLIPVTTVDFSSSTFNTDFLAVTLETFAKEDDVWGEAFLLGE